MADNKSSYDNGQLSDYSQFIYSQLLEGLATISNFEDSSSKFPEAEGKIDQEVEDVFNLLLVRVIIQPKGTSPQSLNSSQQKSNLLNKIAPTFLMQLSLIGSIFCFFAAILAKLISPVIAPAATYMGLWFCFFGVFILLWEIRWFRQFKSSEKVEEDFEKDKYQAVTSDWQIINEIIKTANYKKKVLQYVENKVGATIEQRQDKIKGLDKLLKIGAIFIVVVGIGIFNPSFVQILVDNIFSGNILAVSATLAVLLVVGSGIVLIYGFIFESRDKVKISSYKMCLYLLKQAQLLVDRNGQ